MNTPDVAATVASLRALRQSYVDMLASGGASLFIDNNVQVADTSRVAIDTLEQQGNRFAAGDFSPFGDEATAWSAWSDVAQSTADSLNASMRVNAKWTVTYFAEQVADRAGDNLKGLGLGAGALLLGLAVLFIVLETR
jgi:hypothetical protein